MTNHTIAEQLPGILPPAGELSLPIRPLALAGRQAAGVVVDGLMLLVLILCIPLVILAVGTPVALLVQLLLWLGRLL
jgi:hypothetical protein